MAYDRATLQALAKQRLAEANLLQAHGHYSGAYYLAGYAVECALKARIAKGFRAEEIPDRSLVNSVYTHSLKNLIHLAALEEELETATEASAVMHRRWSIVARWSENARYEIWTREAATDMLVPGIKVE